MSDMTIGQLGHHVGLHVDVNLDGKVVGGELFEQEHWVSGVIVGLSALGEYLTIELDEPIGAEPGTGLLHRGSKGQGTISIDDPARVRPKELADVAADGATDEIAELVRKGKTLEAIKRYRALNGATMDEAKAYVARLSR